MTCKKMSLGPCFLCARAVATFGSMYTKAFKFRIWRVLINYENIREVVYTLLLN